METLEYFPKNLLRHLVAAKDIRWLLPLTAQRNRKAYESYVKKENIDISLFVKACDLICKTLEGHNYLTKSEIVEMLIAAGFPSDNSFVGLSLFTLETNASVCSGADKGDKATYALFEERVPVQPVATKEEALARLADRYFRSHSPASLLDFAWWSGLSMTEAREAISYIRNQLVTDRFAPQELFVHDSCLECKRRNSVLHLMPSYDEYLISYKDRSTVLDLQHQHHAYNNWGIFYPVILRGGRVVGNWKKSGKGEKMKISHTLFPEESPLDPKAFDKAVQRYRKFLTE